MTPIEKHIEFEIKFHDSSLMDRNALEESATAILRRIKVTEVKSAGSAHFIMRGQEADIRGYGVLEDAPNRKEVLLRACYDLLTKLENSYYVLEAASTTVFYDEADCDGSCLRGDIKAELGIEEE